MFKKQLGFKKNKEDDLDRRTIEFIKVPIVAIVGILGFYLFNFGMQGISSDQEIWAQFGDYFGGILNPILAFIALIALLKTIQLQSRALEVSKEELSATRKELEKSRLAQEEQSQSLKLQNKATNIQVFESTFFQLSNQWSSTRESLKISKLSSENNSGYENGAGGCATITIGIDNEDLHHYTSDLAVNGQTVIRHYLTILKKYYEKYDEFNDNYELYTGSYFGQAYQIIKFIDETKITNKQRYINIFRAQFTKNELEFLFYHCLGSIGKRKFKKLIEKYEFFEHIIHNDDIDKPLKEYDIRAFGRNEFLLNKYNGVS